MACHSFQALFCSSEFLLSQNINITHIPSTNQYATLYSFFQACKALNPAALGKSQNKSILKALLFSAREKLFLWQTELLRTINHELMKSLDIHACVLPKWYSICYCLVGISHLWPKGRHQKKRMSAQSFGPFTSIHTLSLPKDTLS